jgi:hypothetical protein
MENIYCSSSESARILSRRTMENIYCSSCESARILSRRTMENIYCSSCESARIFEPKNNGKDLLQQLRIGEDFQAEEIKEKAIMPM